ncbi:hypothetical protein HN51_011175 [Arachis hypogaea]|nr:H/ACA ribonucleoprotein complex non-core subunit NAF1 [Arachis hypogaea]QHO56406.1 H/ACA ribonucleoprotein complex non-core subunit [Arachis hypogaea]
MDSQHSAATTTTNNTDGVPLADTNGSGLDPNSNGPIKSNCEKVETLGCAIEEAVEKISLLGASEAEVKAEIEAESESDEESESSTSSSSESSSSSSEESGSGDSDSDDDDEEEEENGEDADADVEVEEGEIDGSDDDDDGEKMVSWIMEDDGGDGDDDEADVGGGEPIKSKNELEDLPPVPPINVTLEPSHQMRPVGVVMSKLGAKVIVEGVEKHDPLSEGSILWITESRKPLGLIDEIFGPVKNPYYVVRYNSENEVPTEVQGGTSISFVPEFANYVLNNKDLYKKGYDASGANDEELSDELEFSDDEKEAEYRRMQRMAKRGPNDQNPSKSKHNKKKVSPQKHAVTSIPKASAPPAAPPHDRRNCLPFPGQGQGPFAGTSAFPPFPIPNSNAGPNIPPNGVWTNGATLPQQPLPTVIPNIFPTNGMPWCPQNTQFPHQLPMAMPGVPFQQQLPQGAMLPGVVQQNILAQAAIYAQGLMAQNQMAFGLNSPPFPQIQQPPMVQQGFPHNELSAQSSPNRGGPPQFHPGASASNNGGKTFHGGGRGGRKGWRPAK